MRMKIENEKLIKTNEEMKKKEGQYKKDTIRNKIKIKEYERAIIILNRQTGIVNPREMTAKNKKNPSPEKRIKGKVKQSRREQEKTYRNKKIICKYEDRGRCKEGKRCTFFHPLGTCPSYSELGSCTHSHACGVCHEWEIKGKCERKDKGKFRHPRSLQSNHFLGRAKNSKSLTAEKNTALNLQQQHLQQGQTMNHQNNLRPQWMNFLGMNPLQTMPSPFPFPPPQVSMGNQTK